MTIQIFNPVGEVEVIQRREETKIERLTGRRVGFIFNQHISAQAFWKTLEQQVETTQQPASVQRVHKANTWAPAPKLDMERVLAETDYALIGVGA